MSANEPSCPTKHHVFECCHQVQIRALACTSVSESLIPFFNADEVNVPLLVIIIKSAIVTVRFRGRTRLIEQLTAQPGS